MNLKNRTVGTTFASDGTFLRLHKEGDIAFWNGRCIFRLSKSQ